MSVKCGNLSSLLLSEHFGYTVKKIHDDLLWGPKTLSLLVSSTGLPVGVVRKGLCVMIQYGFVCFEQGKSPNIAEYILYPEKVLLLLRYPRYLSLISRKFGEPAQLLIDEVLKNGCITATNAIISAWKRIDEIQEYRDGLGGLRDLFCQLIVKHYLICCPTPSSDRVPVMSIDESRLFSPPDLNLKKLMEIEQNIPAMQHDDVGMYWRVHFDRLHQDMRDEIMISGLKRRFDDDAGNMLEVLMGLIYLRTEPWVSQSNPVPYLELRDALDKKDCYPHLVQYLEQYFKIIEEDSSSFVRRFGESSSGSIFVNFVTAFRNLAGCAIENLVEQRFGPKAARIFRLVKYKKFMDQEQIQKLAMIPDKEAKQLTYKLLQENFLQIMELRKSSGGGINKNFYVFHVDLNQVARVVLEICYKAIFNTLTRAEHEKKENIRLIEKQEKLNSIAECMRQQGTDENQIQELIDEWITPPERELLDSIKSMINKLQLAEIYVDETIFIIQLFIFYQSCSIREKS